MNKVKLKEMLTEAVGRKMCQTIEKAQGKWHTELDYNAWLTWYSDIPENRLPPYTVELNHFRTEVDQFVGQLMMIFEEYEKEKAPD